MIFVIDLSYRLYYIDCINLLAPLPPPINPLAAQVQNSQIYYLHLLAGPFICPRRPKYFELLEQRPSTIASTAWTPDNPASWRKILSTTLSAPHLWYQMRQPSLMPASSHVLSNLEQQEKSSQRRFHLPPTRVCSKSARNHL